MGTATSAGGSCLACTAATGSAYGCAAACPLCVNTIDNYLAACAGDFNSLSYEALDGFISKLTPGSDCFDWATAAARPYAVAACGAAFDHVVQARQSAAGPNVTVVAGVMTVPYACRLANATYCPAACQQDLNLLAEACHAEDAVAWDGNGMTGALSSNGAAVGTELSPREAFDLFVSGVAAVPPNLRAGVTSATPLPLVLTACGNNTGIYPYYSPPPPPPPSPPMPPPPPGGLAPPQITVAPLPRKVSPDGKLLVNATVVSMGEPASLTMAWALAPAALAEPITPLTQRMLVLPPGALVANSTYNFSLSASDSIGASSTTVAVPVAARPSGAPVLAVQPSTGVAFKDTFTLTTSGWKANENNPDAVVQLEYAFSYTLAEKPDAAPVLLQDFSAATAVSFLLPAGTASFAVVARNGYAALSTVNVTATASATLPPGLNDAADLMPSVSGAAAAALAGGNAAGAASLAAAMADLLTDPNAAPDTPLASQQSARDGLLDTLSGAAAATVSPGALSATAAAAASVVAGGVEGLSAAGAGAAVGLLTSLAGAPGGTMPAAAAGSLAAAASSLGTSAAASPEMLSGLGDVVGQLGASLLAGLSAPGEAAVITSAAIQMSLAVDDPSAPGSRLFSAPLTAPGSTAAFAPLPAGALAGATAGAPVHTTFSSLAFDANTGSSSSATGVVTLAFSNPDGSEIPVANLTTPIFFAMPALDLAPGMQAACRYWDAPSASYSGAGCATMPNPAPPAAQLTLAWLSDVVLASPSQVATSWAATGPLAAGCAETVLDCSNATQRSRQVALDPTDIFSPGKQPIGCGGATSGVLRLFTGAGCALYRTDNAAGCFWNSTSQAFSGNGCMAANATQCACTHLTSFTGEPAPKIAVCSASDMLNLNPADLVSKLKVLFAIVVGLFGMMHVGAAFGLVQDVREKRAYLERLHAPSLGFVEQKCGAWTWYFSQLPLESDLGAVPGNLMEIARIIGVPFARVRCAIPEELCAGVTAQMVGRKDGLSASSIESHADERMRLLHRMFSPPAHHDEDSYHKDDGGHGLDRMELCDYNHVSGDVVVQRSPRIIPATELAADDHIQHSAPAEEHPLFKTVDDQGVPAVQRIAATALLYAVISMRNLLPEFEIAQRQVATAEYFTAAGMDEPDAPRFFELLRLMKCMMASDNIRKSGQWLDRARLWRLILLAQPDGRFEPTQGLALALQAVRAKPAVAVTKTRSRLAKLWTLAGIIAGMAAAFFVGMRKRSERPTQVVEVDDRHEMDDTALDDFNPEDEEEEVAVNAEKAAPRDCPLTYSLVAILHSTPRFLVRKDAPDEPGLSLHAARVVWTTALAAATMGNLDVNWATSGPGYPGLGALGDGETPLTLLDGAETWLEQQPLTPAALARVHTAARHRVAEWARVQNERITDMRAAELRTMAHGATIVQRTAGSLVQTLLCSHQTFSVFLTPYLDCIRRWQCFIALLSSILCVLVVNIWMYWSKALNCCLEARALVGCSPVTAEPCLGYTGDCADLATVFAGISFENAPGIPDDYVCLQFPNDDSQRDSLILGLISWAVSLPVIILILNCFWCANAPDYDPAWLRWDFQRRIFMGRANWRYAPSDGTKRPSAAKRCAATAWGVNIYYNTQQYLIERPTAFFFRIAQRRRVRRGLPELDPAGRLGAGLMTQIKMQLFGVIGMAATYLIWALMSWIIFTYGSLVYRLMGDEAQSKFAEGWGVGLAISQATQFKDMVIVALQSALVLTVLETLWLVGNKPWLEEHIDFASVQAALLVHSGTSWWQRMKNHVEFFAVVA